MLMDSEDEFVDYYGLLQVTPTCDAPMLEKAYRHFASIYHPDHAETADVGKFQEIIDAYQVLRDPIKRADYDKVYRLNKGDPESAAAFKPDIGIGGIGEKSALADAEDHEKILLALYKRRREQAGDAGVIGYHIQDMLKCSDESYDFHVWYLKSKGFIEVTEQGTLAITIEGVDHVISMSRHAEEQKLLSARRDEAED